MVAEVVDLTLNIRLFSNSAWQSMERGMMKLHHRAWADVEYNAWPGMPPPKQSFCRLTLPPSPLLRNFAEEQDEP